MKSRSHAIWKHTWQRLWSVFGLAVLWLLSQLPRASREALAAGLSSLSLRYNPRLLRSVAANIHYALPEYPEAQQQQMQRDYLQHYYRSILDGARLWSLSAKQISREVHIHGGEWVSHYLRRGKPVILHVHHTTALEFAALALAVRFPIVGYARATKDPVLNYCIDNTRRRLGVELYHRGDSLRRIISALRRGRVLYYFADEDHGPKHSRFLPLFGKPKATICGLSRLARQVDAAVLHCDSWWDAKSGRYQTAISPAQPNFPSNDVWHDALRINQKIEQMIQRNVSQYLWKLEIFKTRPEGENSIYT